jgi:type I restriction enzyme S subunit
MFLSVENIKSLKSEKYISEEDFIKDFNIFPEKGDVLMTRIGDIGTANVVESNEPKAYYVSLALLKRKALDPYFLKESISSETVKNDLWKRTLHIAFPKKINKNEIAEVLVPYPEKREEQEQIGIFFKNLDNLITLHQRKQEYLCIIQLGLFYKFTSTWEQRKLGNIVERIVRKNTNNESTLPLTISAQYGLVDQITYFNNRVASRDVSNYYLVLNGEFAYNKSTSDGFPFGAVKRLDLYENGVLSTLYIVFSIRDCEETNSDFLAVFFDTDRWHKGVSERAAEGARNHGLLNISADDFLDVGLFIPRENAEQKQIGTFFKNLNNLITLHQRKPYKQNQEVICYVKRNKRY